MNQITNVGFIGLGNMGAPMAANLIKSGFNVTVFDIRQNVLEAFIGQHGGISAASAADAGRSSQAVITMLPDGHVVRRVVTGEGPQAASPLVGAMAKDSILIDMSSSAPGGTMNLGGILARHDIAMIDAPVSGGVSRAVSGSLAIMAGGDAAVIERCRPLFEAMGARVFTTGPLGSGHAMKVLNNLVSAAGLIAAAEALIIGRRFNLSPSVMIDVLNASTGRNNSTENKFKQFILSRAFNSGFSLDLMVKDLTTAVEMARESGTPALFSSACRELWAAALATAPEQSDHTAVVRWLEGVAKEKLTGDDIPQ